MNLFECERWTRRYSGLKITVVGDFCLDRYFDINPALSEVSIETGLLVYNIGSIRCYAGAAGTIVNNLVALGCAKVWPIGFSGDDAEGWALRRALNSLQAVDLAHFETTPEVKTFTYSKPLIIHPGRAPEELNRLDIKNWSPTPQALQNRLASSLEIAAEASDAIIVLDQVDAMGTGVITRPVLEALEKIGQNQPKLLILGDSRRSLANWPPIVVKMNARELGLIMGSPVESIEEVQSAVETLANRNQRIAFVTLAERGIVGGHPGMKAIHVPSRPVRGPIDIVGAGDSVTANLTMALASGAELGEAMELAMAAASHVIHQLGTTGTATVADLRASFS